MIIDLNITMEDYYDKMRNKENRLCYQCPTCSKKQIFWRHGTYKRNVVYWNGKIRERKFIVQRGCCTGCGHTHSILPYEILPNRIFHVSFLIKLFRLLHIQKKRVISCSSILQISYQYQYLFIKNLFRCENVQTYTAEFHQIKFINGIQNEKRKEYLFYFLLVKILSGNRFLVGFDTG